MYFPEAILTCHVAVWSGDIMWRCGVVMSYVTVWCYDAMRLCGVVW